MEASRPTKARDRDAFARPHTVTKVTAGRRVPCVGGQRDFREGPKVEGGHRLGEVIQPASRPPHSGHTVDTWNRMESESF